MYECSGVINEPYCEYDVIHYHRLHSVHGNHWSKIGRLLGVSGRAAQDKYRSLTRNKNKGLFIDV